MQVNAIIGLSVILFVYALFSWALGRFINRKKDPKTSEFQNFLLGGLIIGVTIGLIMLIYYLFN